MGGFSFPGFDVNNQFAGALPGHDRIGHTTPDMEASEILRPWLPVPYPAPYLRALRADQGHPQLANVVLSSQQTVGLDKSGAIVPTGLFCGKQPAQNAAVSTAIKILDETVTITAANSFAKDQMLTIGTVAAPFAALSGASVKISAADATDFSFHFEAADVAQAASVATFTPVYAGQYCVIVYQQGDVNYTYNPQTGTYVQAAGEHVFLAAPADAATNDVITLPDGTVVSPTAGDITFAFTCNLFPGGKVRPLGCVVRNVFQYLGGVEPDTAVANWLTGGIQYVLNTMNPTSYRLMNYMHEPGTPIQTEYFLKVPWIGATPQTLMQDAVADFGQSNQYLSSTSAYGRTFAHFTGPKADSVGNLFTGCLVVGSRAGNGQDAGNFAPYDPNIHDVSDIVGRVYGTVAMYPVKDYLNRVRTLWDPTRLLGPIRDPNPASIMMGGSATGGVPYDLSLITGGIFKLSQVAGTTPRPEYYTYVLIKLKA